MRYTEEQQARDILQRMGLMTAHKYSDQEVSEIAQLIRDKNHLANSCGKYVMEIERLTKAIWRLEESAEIFEEFKSFFENCLEELDKRKDIINKENKP